MTRMLTFICGFFTAIALALLAVLFTSLAPLPPACVTSWQGNTDLDMLRQVQDDLAAAQGCPVLVVSLFSPGGPVITSVEIARELRRAEEAGLLVEIHGRSMVASGAVLVIAAGSPGHRYIDRGSFVLLHGMQVTTPLGQYCLPWNDTPEKGGDPQGQRLLYMLVNELQRTSGRSTEEVKSWLACEKTIVGGSTVLVERGLADHEEG